MSPKFCLLVFELIYSQDSVSMLLSRYLIVFILSPLARYNLELVEMATAAEF
jgi:hypothetical protein